MHLGWAQQRDWLAVGTTKGEIAVLDTAVEAKPVVARQTYGDRPVTTLAWSPKASRPRDLAFVCHGPSVCLWRSNAGPDAREPFKPAVRFDGHAQCGHTAKLGAAGVRLASGSADGTIRIWSLTQDTDASSALYSDEASSIGTVAVSADRQWVAGGSADGSIRLWHDEDRCSRPGLQAVRQFGSERPRVEPQGRRSPLFTKTIRSTS